MSGLAAIIRTDGGPADTLALDQMVSAMAHKGPDGCASWTDGGVGLAHAMLHTTSQSLSADQPLVRADGRYAIIMDGLLTNYEDLQRELTQRGIVPRNQSDAELILGAYEVWGEECVSRCDGEFAFVLWDSVKRTALCARDHQGLRPLLYVERKGRVVIASDLRTLNAGLGHQGEPNFNYLAQMASGQFYSASQTATKNVFRFLPAHSYEISSKGVSHKRYWSLPKEVTIRYRRDEEYIEHYREVLTACVRKASRTHHPLALEVSGGLDSSATYCLAHALLGCDELPAPEVRGYTLFGKPGTDADEISYARAAARHVGDALTEVPLFEPALEWYIAYAKSEQDLPPYTNAAMSIGLENVMVADGCRVSVGGTGGDQWLDGTLDYYIQHIRSLDMGEFFKAIARDVSAFGVTYTLSTVVRKSFAAILPLRLANRLRSSSVGEIDGEVEDYFWLSDRSKESLAKGFADLTRRYSHDPVLARKNLRLERAEFQLALDFMNRQHSRAHIESRSPLFSKEFIEFSASTPEHIRYRSGQTKWVHREAMRGIVPNEILERESKASFPAVGLTDQAREFCYANSRILCSSVCDPVGLNKMLTNPNYQEFDSDISDYLWGCFASAAFLSTHEAKCDLRRDKA